MFSLKKASSKIVQSKLMSANTMRVAMAAASNSLVNSQAAMGLMTLNKTNGRFNKVELTKTSVRGFSSLPDHIVLEMPNLSPTMEKVTSTPLFTYVIIG